MNIRYQNGHVRCRKRKDGSSCWVFMWREQDSSGKRLRRTIMIGSTEKYPTKELAEAAVSGVRMRINEERNRRLDHALNVSDLMITILSLNYRLRRSGIHMRRDLYIESF